MKKKLLILPIILILAASLGITYLNKVVLPTKLKSLVIKNLQELTHRQVGLESLRFNIFRGLVLKNLSIYDSQGLLLDIKEATCALFILPIFKKMLVIPSLRLDSAVLYLERNKDHTFNLQDLLSMQPPQGKKGGFSVSVLKIKLTNSTINFKDNTFDNPFKETLGSLNLTLRLSLPASVKFSLVSEVPINPPITIKASGEYQILDKQLTANCSIKDFSAKEFQAYYQDTGILVPEGLIDALIRLDFKDSFANASFKVKANAVAVKNKGISALLNSETAGNIKYSLQDKNLEFSGKSAITNSKISGLDLIEEIEDINTDLAFNNSGLSSDKLNASVWGIPLQAKVKLQDFSNPMVAVDAVSNLDFPSVKNILKDKLNFAFPGVMQGDATVGLSLEGSLASYSVNGYLETGNGLIKLDALDFPLEGVSGRLEFSRDQLKWPLINFKYQGTAYQTTGELLNFKEPEVKFNLRSQELKLQSELKVKAKLIHLSKMQGGYLNSKFTLTGDVDTGEFPVLAADIEGKLSLDLEDLKVKLTKFEKQLEKINPKGLIEAGFSLNGNAKDLKSCRINALLSAPSVSAYGFNTGELLLSYNQKDYIGEVSSASLAMYDGKLEAAGKINLESENLPFWLNINAQDIKLEKLKLDTAARRKAIAGTINAGVETKGFVKDASKLIGTGRISITDGKLWELNLFQGLGSLLFTKDFSSISFSEGSCDFSIKDKVVSTDNLILKSEITNLTGRLSIGFDGSLDGLLDVQVLDEMVPLSGTFKDVTTAILGQADRYGQIKIGGTLQKPELKPKSQVVDILKGLLNTFLKNKNGKD